MNDGDPWVGEFNNSGLVFPLSACLISCFSLVLSTGKLSLSFVSFIFFFFYNWNIMLFYARVFVFFLSLFRFRSGEKCYNFNRIILLNIIKFLDEITFSILIL